MEDAVMKKILAVVLLVFLLPLGVWAENLSAAKEAVVANPQVADRLILRESPAKDGKIMGRFYSGTPVTILSENDGWSHVRLGALEGYMMSNYLAHGLPNYPMPAFLFTAPVTKENAPLYNKASTKGDVIARADANVYVLGDIDNDWRYVQSGDVCGYMRAAHLGSKNFHVPVAYLNSETPFYRDKKLKTKTGYTGNKYALVRVTDVSRTEGWAQVEATGFPWHEQMESSGFTGYIDQKRLDIFVFPWLQNNAFFPVGKTLSSISLQNEAVPLPTGTLVTIIGETDTKYHILCDQAQGVVSKNEIQSMPRHTASNNGIRHTGYALLPAGDERRWEMPSVLRLIHQEGQRLQVAYGHSFTGFTDAENTVLLNLKKPLDTLPEGAFTISAEEEGLWMLSVEKGQTATLSMTNEKWNIHMEKRQFTQGYYTYFLPEGTTGVLEGASFTGNVSVFIDDGAHPTAGAPSRPVFSGSGRFFCDWQIAFNSNFYGFWAEPIPGSEEAYVHIVSLNTLDEEEAQGRFINLMDLNHPDENCFRLLPGEFVEVHNCRLYYDFGNG